MFIVGSVHPPVRPFAPLDLATAAELPPCAHIAAGAGGLRVPSFHPKLGTVTPLIFRLPNCSPAGQCNISSASVGQLQGLSRLRRLDLSYNALDSFEALDPVVQPCAVLGSLDLRGNPICR